ncbi:hypothetical protein GCM10022406_19690 [Hymenobacter algoricola]|uniref:Uncharacterized protein n=1 Tax=Hymenobacter algoricola TaxID=486267 RepID=A0ABP7N2M0_9BACT
MTNCPAPKPEPRRFPSSPGASFSRLSPALNQPTTFAALPLPKVYPSPVQPASPRKTQSNRLQIGHYQVGEDSYSNLFGPPDVR